ncbi:MAG: primosomal protein N' [Verrucomicrobiota bacterium]|nr:primosomal protein N' [Verrucomicrobiota bacterium]
MSSTLFVSVVLDQNLKKPLDYAVPEQWQRLVQVGMRVEVPLRSSLQKATIVALKETSNIPHLKEIARLLSAESALSDPLWKLAHWMAHYYAAPLQRVMKCFIPPSLRKEVRPKKEFLFFLALTKDEAITHIASLREKRPKQADLLEQLLHAPKGLPAAQLNSSPEALLKKKWIRREEKASSELSNEEFFPTYPKKLNEEQSTCLEKITASLRTEQFAAHLIQGVTGSGKTEVYLQAIQTTLDLGKSAIMLVPEISLTSQTIERFRSRFQEKIAIWHHRRSLGERTTAWNLLKNGQAQIVIGARSAIFCPAQKVGLIIVDEEHDASYKQSEEIPCYHGRDIAVMRAHIERATVLLGSATPSLESRYNADIGKYTLSKLNSRATSATIPKVSIIDMKQVYDRVGGFTHFSDPLIDALKLRLEAGEQTLLFLNRRGYHRLQMCSACRYIIKCPHCDLSLTFHKNSHELRCHLCDFSQNVPPLCPQCQSRETLQFKGFGTEHVERSLHALLPGVRTLRMDRDTTRQKESHEELYKQFRAHKADVLIGTQMIAKGFHFPSVTLVGVLNADAALHIPDFRSAEQLFQLITQVAGRSGRSELPGEVILQTFLPDHPLLKLAAAQDYEAFYQVELAERRLFQYPPFCHLVKITCSSPHPDKAQEEALQIHAQLQKQLSEGPLLLPVLPAGHPKIKDQYRFQFIIKCLKIKDLSSLLEQLTTDLNCKIDVDPINTFF